MTAQVETTLENGVATLRMTRPEARNALSEVMVDTMRTAIADYSENPDVRVLRIEAMGRAFCAGADLNDPMMGLHLPAEEQPAVCLENLDGLLNGLIRDIQAAPFPTLGIVSGIAAGGGVGLALAADIVIAGRSAKFIQGFVPQLALVPDMGVTWQNANLLGRARAMGALLLGDPIPAEKAADWGLIWQMVEDDELASVADDLSKRLADGPTGAQIATRGLIDDALSTDLDHQLRAEAVAQSKRVTSPDVAEAVAAFQEKRPPNFKG